MEALGIQGLLFFLRELNMACNREDNTIERVLAGKATKMLNRIRKINNEINIKLGEKVMKFDQMVLGYAVEHRIGTTEDWIGAAEKMETLEEILNYLYDERRKLNVKVVS